MARAQVHIRCSEVQYTSWQQAAAADERELVDWARRVLDLAADSGLTIVQIRDLFAQAGRSSGKEGKNAR